MGHPRPLSRPVGPIPSDGRSLIFQGSKSLFTDPAITTRPFPVLWPHSHAIANHFPIGHPSFHYSSSSTLNSGVLSGCVPEKNATPSLRPTTGLKTPLRSELRRLTSSDTTYNAPTRPRLMGHPRPLSRPVGPIPSDGRSLIFQCSKSLFTDPAITTRPFPVLWPHSHAIANHFPIGHPSFHYSSSSTLNSGVVIGEGLRELMYGKDQLVTACLYCDNPSRGTTCP
ncbi:V-type proton ATPase proteolipid subunit [Raphanus sativus]|nr:V-type proton ATPase proteolipid subunit [Raphanus sativus]